MANGLKEIEGNHIAAEEYLTKNLTDTNGFRAKGDKLNLGFAEQGNIYDKDLQNYNMATIEEWVAGGFGNKTDSNSNDKSIRKMILDLVYPIGSIYLSFSNINPSKTLGGTWIQCSQGRFLVGVGESDNIFEPKETGGSSKAWLHSHEVASNGSHTHTASFFTKEKGAHTHHPSPPKTITSKNNKKYNMGFCEMITFGSSETGKIQVQRTNSGWTVAAANNKDYIQASGMTQEGSHTHDIYGEIDYAGTHTHDLSSTGQNNCDPNIANLPPYQAIYIWQRTE